MIYKFIDDSGSVITVNSLSQLQALIESQTIKKNTKVKAGLRGKWGKAEDLPDLKFEEEKKEESEKEIEDIESYVTRESTPPPKKEEIKKTEKHKVITEKPIENEEIIKSAEVTKQPEVPDAGQVTESINNEKEIASPAYVDLKASDQKQNLHIETNKHSASFFKKLLKGKFSLKLSFWGFYLLPNLIFSIFLLFILLPVALEPNAKLQVVLFYYVITIIVIIYLIMSLIGTWKSANHYRNFKKIDNKPYGLGIVAQIFVCADILLKIIGLVSQYG
jgi:hypothetical protein|tara:strand:+ start:2121 stop:2948 length:828 start_codon:yes stop_codon:yes gene_type:complete